MTFTQISYNSLDVHEYSYGSCCSVPPSRLSLDLHSTGKNSTCSLVRSEKCFSSILRAASRILEVNKHTHNYLPKNTPTNTHTHTHTHIRTDTNKSLMLTTVISLALVSLQVSAAVRELTCWCSWWCDPGPSSGQCRAPRTQCESSQGACPRGPLPPHIRGEVAFRCSRLEIYIYTSSAKWT